MRGIPVITIDATDVWDSQRDAERDRGPSETRRMRVMVKKLCAVEVIDVNDPPGPEVTYTVRLWVDNGMVVEGTLPRGEMTSRLISQWELRNG